MIKKQDKTEKKNPFRVPDGYFEEVNRNIISSTSGTNQSKRRSGLIFKLRPYLMAAASVAGFIVLSYTAIKVIAPHRINQRESEVIPEEYFFPYLNDLDIYSIEENAASLSVSEHVPDVSKAEIIEYLVFENIEISDIYEQL
jgi:hypothetical protein